jgi:hypothetical protein
VVADIEERLQECVFNLYPNPTNGQLYFNFSGSRQNFMELHILDLLGRVHAQKKLKMVNRSFSGILDVSDLAPGVYLARVQNGSQLVIRKFMKL